MFSLFSFKLIFVHVVVGREWSAPSPQLSIFNFSYWNAAPAETSGLSYKVTNRINE